MGLSKCTECGTIEGKWETGYVTEQTAHAGLGAPGEAFERCGECEAVESRIELPGYDDDDVEREYTAEKDAEARELNERNGR